MKGKKKKNTAKNQKQWFFRNSSNETNTIEIRHNKYPFPQYPCLKGANQVHFLFFLVSLVVERGGTNRLRE